MGHICMLMTMPGSMMSSHTDGRIMAWCPSRPRLFGGVAGGGGGGAGTSVDGTAVDGGFEVDGEDVEAAAVEGTKLVDVLVGTVCW